ncbi:MAG: hypothetical protein HGA77_05595 [Chlorobiaceae bacterium]|nr:hypothetical protein [Chlorobiaceae bacterium]
MERLNGLQRILEIRNLRNRTNPGCGCAWTQGIVMSPDAEWVILLNNDVLAGPDAIGALLRAAEREKFGVASPALLEGVNDYDFNGFSGEKVRRMVGAVRMGKFHGVCFAIHRNVISEIRFPDTDKKPVHPKLNIKTSWGKKKATVVSAGWMGDAIAGSAAAFRSQVHRDRT